MGRGWIYSILIFLLVSSCANMPHKKWDDSTKFLFGVSIAVQTLDAYQTYDITQDPELREGHMLAQSNPDLAWLAGYIILTSLIKYGLIELVPPEYKNAVPSFFIGANTLNVIRNQHTYNNFKSR